MPCTMFALGVIKPNKRVSKLYIATYLGLCRTNNIDPNPTPITFSRLNIRGRSSPPHPVIKFFRQNVSG